MTTPEQINSNDQRWANKSWKPYLWMAIAGTVGLIVGFILVLVGPITTDPNNPGIMLAYMIPGVILLVAGELVTMGGVALLVVTMIKSNKAKARLGMKK